MKILMVCLGNICRSPIAEGVFKHEAAERGIDLEVDSAGTSGFHIGEAPDKRSIEFMRTVGIDISNQRARQITHQDLEQFDIIYAMDRNNLRDLQGMCHKEELKSKLKLLLGFESDPSRQIVPDPYYGEMHDFERTYKLCKKAADEILPTY